LTALAVLLAEHRELRERLDALRAASDATARRSLLDAWEAAAAAHHEHEEEILLPQLRWRADAWDDAATIEGAHRLIREHELDVRAAVDSDDQSWVAAVDGLWVETERHREIESRLLEAAASLFTESELAELGAHMEPAQDHRRGDPGHEAGDEVPLAPGGGSQRDC
jgi:hypothetical protein